VRNLPQEIGFLISKGGITSNDTLSRGLALRTARVLGQIRAGCSVVRCPEDHPRFPNLPVVIFPGNVGGDEALAEAYEILAASEPRPECDAPVSHHATSSAPPSLEQTRFRGVERSGFVVV
jgi:hypothetical protein